MLLRFAVLALLLLLFPPLVYSQRATEDMGEIMQTYYRVPHPSVVPLLISHLNEQAATEAGQACVRQHECSYLGFFSTLAATDTAARRALSAGLSQITDSAFRRVIRRSVHTPPAELLVQQPLSPAYNDMVWAAYFASGAPQYLALLLTNCSYAAERKDRNLYFTGASARWSLCAVARQDSVVQAWLTAQQRTSKEARLLLRSDPQELRQAITDVFVRYQQKGAWQ